MKKMIVLLSSLLAGSLGYCGNKVGPNSSTYAYMDCPVAYTGLQNSWFGNSVSDCYYNYEPYGYIMNRASSWGFSGIRRDSRKVFYFDIPAEGYWVLRGKLNWIAANAIFGLGGGVTMAGYRVQFASENNWQQGELAGSASISLPIPTFGLQVLKEFMDAKSIVDNLKTIIYILDNDYKILAFGSPYSEYLYKGSQAFGIVSLFTLTSTIGGITAYSGIAGNITEIYAECISGACTSTTTTSTTSTTSTTTSGGGGGGGGGAKIL